MLNSSLFLNTVYKNPFLTLFLRGGMNRGHLAATELSLTTLSFIQNTTVIAQKQTINIKSISILKSWLKDGKHFFLSIQYITVPLRKLELGNGRNPQRFNIISMSLVLGG